MCAGRTTQGSTNWQVHTSYSVYVDVDISQCGFEATPVLVTSVGGTSSHWTSMGGSEFYSLSTTGFRNYVNYGQYNDANVSPDQANSWNWHMQYMAAPPMSSDAICTGRTTYGSTNWQVHTSYSVYVDVDISHCGFSSVPILVTSVGGSSSHWQSTGGSEFYSLTTTGFRNYVNFVEQDAVSPDQANSWNWHINYMAVAPDTVPNGASQLCAGRTTQGSTNWQVHTSYSVYIDVDISHCGFSSTPVIVTSVGGTSSHWQSTGGSEIYSISATGFRNYVNFGPNNQAAVSPDQANSWNWHINYLAYII